MHKSWNIGGRLTSAVAVLLAGAALLSAGPAAADPQVGRGYNADGGNWSGYVTAGREFSSVSAQWTEPAVTCNATTDAFAPWVGLGGFGTNMVEQTGVETSCAAGVPVYRAWYELAPAPPVYYDDPVGPGDLISAEVTRAGTRYTLTVTDHTRNWSRTVARSYNGSNTSAEFILESPTGTFPNFGTVTFTGASVDGRPLSTFTTLALDARGGYDDHTGALAGDTFSVSYRHGAAAG
ncbi:G1 family glutamic endopeptidase [Pseudonocardia sp.]|uniref:G1 family glutamic endopeptidase n=1 Tax=Pseudonocardia sp. TaxID=60912 RepID=UPI0031FD399B